MTVLIVNKGLQGNKGATGDAAPSSITVANNIDNVNAVGDSIDDVNTCADNLAAILDAPNQAQLAANNAASATFFYCTATGTSNPFTLTTGSDITLAAGQAFRFKSSRLTTGITTVQVDSNLVRNIKLDGVIELPPYAIKKDQMVTIIYDGNHFQPLALGPITGDVIMYSGTTRNGWVPIDGTTTIGNASSGADYAGDHLEGLFKLFWSTISSSDITISGGKGASSQADWDANKTITMPDPKDRSLHVVGSTLTQFAKPAGASTVQSAGSISINQFFISQANMPSHYFNFLNNNNNATRTNPGAGDYVSQRSAAVNDSDYQLTVSSGGAAANVGRTNSLGSGSGITPTGSFTGSSTSVLHPVFGVNLFVKI